jgi:uncharacterized membrane protein YvlD (DUF360 family)
VRAFGLRILLSIAATAIAFVICAVLLDGFDLNATQFIWAVIIFSIVNWLVPIVVFGMIRERRSASLGLILLLANAATLLVTNWLSDGITIDGVGTLILATIIIWLVNWLIFFVPGPWKRQRVARAAG